MTKENKNMATLLTLLCVWPGFLILANDGFSGWPLMVAYVFWLLITLFIWKTLFRDRPIKLVEGTITPIYDVPLKALGFSYNVQHDRWQIGCLGAPCFAFYYPASSNGIPNLMECSNYVSGNDEHFVRVVHSMEEIRMVLNTCGITEGMIEKAQEKWGR